MPTRLRASRHVARIWALLTLSVSPSQAAPDRQTTAHSDLSNAFTAYVRGTLNTDPKGHTLRLQALTQALEQQLLQQAEKSISPEAIAAYYRQHQDHFQQPEAIELWRLLAASEEQAKDLIAKLMKSSDQLKTWITLVREHSLDKATHFRRGSLGYVWPDGNTDVPQVRVASGLFAAAKGLKDGELLPHPVREGEYWALVWRRASRKAKGQSLEEARGQIRQQLALAQARSAHHALSQELRGKYLSNYHPEVLDSYTPSPEARVEPHKPPLVARPADKSPVPHQTDMGER